MNNSENWSILEKLADSGTSAEERLKLLKEVESDPVLLDKWKAFRVLQTWPELEHVGANDSGDIMISDVVRHSLDGRLAGAFRQIAPLKLKNIERPFLRYLCLKIDAVFFMPNDLIVQKGDLGNEMYYIHRGEVSLLIQTINHFCRLMF